MVADRGWLSPCKLLVLHACYAWGMRSTGQTCSPGRSLLDSPYPPLPLFPQPPRTRVQLAGESRAAAELLALAVVINQAVGDALSGILLVEAALRRKGWGLDQWAALYTDLPSRQLKVKVADRTGGGEGGWRGARAWMGCTPVPPASHEWSPSLHAWMAPSCNETCDTDPPASPPCHAAIVTTDAETRVAQPAGLQAAIDAAVAGAPAGRSFVRPSGTEDVVRVYAEAESQQAADDLAAAVARLVHAQAGGVGPAL